MRIDIHFAGTRGHLWHDDDQAAMSEDMLEADLPDGTLLDVGWQDGRYCIAVTRGTESVSVHRTPDVFPAAMMILDFLDTTGGGA